MKHIDLFSGIGGFALATEMVWDNVEHIFCDNEPFAQSIIKKHWPNSKIYGDIRQFTADSESEQAHAAEPRGLHTEPRVQDRERIDLLTGGFPCQPFSQAGRRLGTEDDRHLWPEMLRVIQEFHPRWIIGENVGGFVTWNEGMVLEQVHTDLESEDYEVQAFIIPAVSVNAPHRRDRVWIVAHRNDTGNGASTSRADRHGAEKNNRRKELAQHGSSRQSADAPDTKRKGRTRGGSKDEGRPGQPDRYGSDQGRNWNQNWPQVATRLCTLDDGLPNGLARPKGWRNAALKGAGNAIVPQVAAEIMKAIKESDNLV